MSDYLGRGRTNSFRVRDLDAFKLDLTRHGVTPEDFNGGHNGAEFALDASPTNTPEGSIILFSDGPWPYFDADMIVDTLQDAGTFDTLWPGVEDVETFEPTYTFLWDLVAAHLIDEEVAVFKESGHQKFAYIGGTAIAVNSHGDTESIDLDDIVELAAKLGRNPVTSADH